MTPMEWNLLHRDNLAKKNQTNFSAEHGDDDDGPDFWPSSIALAQIKNERWEKYLEQLPHRLQLLRETPRVFEEDESPPEVWIML